MDTPNSLPNPKGLTISVKSIGGATTQTYYNGSTAQSVTIAQPPVLSVNGMTGDVVLPIPKISDIYPVGSIYMSTSSTSPSSLFGGSWTELGYGTFLMASGGGYAGLTGGSSSHYHNIGSVDNTNAFALIMINGYPSVAYRGGLLSDYNTGISQFSSNGYLQGSRFTTDASDNGPFTYGTEVIGETKSSDYLPPYYTVHIWRRTA